MSDLVTVTVFSPIFLLFTIIVSSIFLKYLETQHPTSPISTTFLVIGLLVAVTINSYNLYVYTIENQIYFSEILKGIVGEHDSTEVAAISASILLNLIILISALKYSNSITD